MKIDNTSIYWQPCKNYMDNKLPEKKEPGKVRNIHQILKNKRIRDAKNALKLVEEMKLNKRIREEEPIITPPKREPKVSLSKRRDQKEYYNTLEKINVIDELMSKKEFCLLCGLDTYYQAQMMLKKNNIPTITVGRRVFVFKNGVSKRMREIISERLRYYTSFNEVEKKFSKRQIYSSEFLIKHEAVRIDDCILFKKSTL